MTATVSVCEPIPPASARRRVFSVIRSRAENVPSAAVVRVRDDERMVREVSVTGTPACAGTTRPLIVRRPPPTIRRGASSCTAVIGAAPPGGGAAPHEPAT